MKKIGILFGQENTFPQAFVDRINSKKENGITAELAHINKIIQGEPLGYDAVSYTHLTLPTSDLV